MRVRHGRAWTAGEPWIEDGSPGPMLGSGGSWQDRPNPAPVPVIHLPNGGRHEVKPERERLGFRR
jgi:hypothetical protein